MFRYYKKCYCMNNENQNINYNENKDDEECNVLETACKNTNMCECCNDDNCGCGFDEESNIFPENPMLAQSYVPIQYMDTTFKPQIGLKMGTIFPELVSPYMPCQSMRDNEYLAKTNTIGKGCNKCC